MIADVFKFTVTAKGAPYDIPDIWVYRGYNESCTEGINKIRQAFGDQNLIWDKDLAKQSDAWALTQAIASPNKNNVHSKTIKGENLFLLKFFTKGQLENGLFCNSALWAWYE